MTLVTKFKENVSKFADKEAFIFLGKGNADHQYLSYKDLDKEAGKVAALLKRENLVGQYVILSYQAGLDFIIAFLGCLYAGTRAVLVPYIAEQSQVQMLKNATEDFQINTILSTNSKLADYLDIRLIDLGKQNLPKEYYSAEKEINAQTITHVLYTSGSISKPKAVVFNHHCLIHNLSYTGHSWNATSHSRHLTWGLPFHSAGLMVGYLLPIFNGATGIIMSPEVFNENPVTFIKAVSDFQVTHTACANYAYDFLINHMKTHHTSDMDFSKWQVAIVGGDPLQKETLTQFVDHFSGCEFNIDKFCTAYGMTEATGLIASGVPQKGPTIINTNINDIATHKITEFPMDYHGVDSKYLIGCGFANDGVEVVVTDPATLKQLPNNQIGLVFFHSPSLLCGYWNSSENKIYSPLVELPEKMGKKYMNTEDLGFLRNDELFIIGRYKEILKKNNKIYHPLFVEIIAVESYIGLKPRTGAAFSLSNEGDSDIIFIQEIPEFLREKREEILKSIHHAVELRYKLLIDKIIFIKEGSLPKVAGSGKVSRNLCKDLYLKNKLNLELFKEGELCSSSSY